MVLKYTLFAHQMNTGQVNCQGCYSIIVKWHPTHVCVYRRNIVKGIYCHIVEEIRCLPFGTTEILLLYSLPDKVINKACDFTVAARNPSDLLLPRCLVIAGRWKNVQAAVKMSLCRETPGCGPGHVFAVCCSLHSEHFHTFYVIFSLSEKVMAGSGCVGYPNAHSACKSGTHRQKSYLLPLGLRGGNQGK